MDYYTNNAKDYVESTLHVDMQPLGQVCCAIAGASVSHC